MKSKQSKFLTILLGLAISLNIFSVSPVKAAGPAAPTNVHSNASTSSCSITVSWMDNSMDEWGFKFYLKNQDGSYTDTFKTSGMFFSTGIRNISIDSIGSPAVPLVCDSSHSYLFAVSSYNLQGTSNKVDADNTITFAMTPPTIALAENNQTIRITSTTFLNDYVSLEKKTQYLDWQELAYLPKGANGIVSFPSTCYPDENCQYQARSVISTPTKTYSDYSNIVEYNNPALQVPLNPAWLGHVSLDQFPKDSNNGFPQIYGVYDVAVTDNYLYTASSGRLSIYSISNTRGQLPQYVSSIVGVTPYSVAASAIGGKEYAFITDGSTGILKVIDPILPAAVKTINLPGTCNHLNVVGSHAYVACGAAGIVIVDVSDPLNPIQRSVYDTDGTACSVDVEGALAAVADGTNGLVTLNISDPDHPAYLGRVDLPLYNGTGGGIDVDLAGSTAWVANAHSGLSQVNVSAPSQPSLIRTAPTSGLAAGVQVYGGYVFVAGNNGNSPRTGVNVFKINEMTAAPTFLSALGYSTHQVAVRNGTIYLTDNLNLVDVATFYDPTVDKELSLTKSVDKTEVVSGDTVTVTLTMKNVSPNAMHNLVVTDPVLANTSYLPDHATIKIGDGTATPVTEDSGDDAYTLDNGIPTWNFGTMVPAAVAGDTITLTYQVTVNAGAGGTFNNPPVTIPTDTSSKTTVETPAATPTATPNASTEPPVPTPVDVPAANPSTATTSTEPTNTNTPEGVSSTSNITTKETTVQPSTTSSSTSTSVASDTSQKKQNPIIRFFGDLWKKVKGVVKR